MATWYDEGGMDCKDSARARKLHDYYILTVLEDRAESAQPPLPMPADDEETER